MTWNRASAEPPRQLYVLFRVSNVGNDSELSLQAYVDPHDLLARGFFRIAKTESVEVQILGN